MLCQRAAPDEPMFILLGRDRHAAALLVAPLGGLLRPIAPMRMMGKVAEGHRFWPPS